MNWSITNPPPQGHKDVGEWAWNLYQDGQDEKERLNLPNTYLENYRIYSGDHWPTQGNQKNRKNRLVASLAFANVERTVANLTAKTPVVEVVEVDGEENADVAKALTSKIKEWWTESEQASSLTDSTKGMEIYGPTTEKYVWNTIEKRAETVVLDPFAFGMCPGNWPDPNDAPYCYHLLPMRPDEIALAYGVNEDDIETDDIYSVLCEEREERISSNTLLGASNYSGISLRVGKYDSQYRNKRALVVELWVRDYTQETTTDEAGETTTTLKYPGGIRVITVTNGGKMVLSDEGNPNINPELPLEATSQTWLFDRFPFGMATSYKDMVSPWGFSAIVQTGDICLKIGELLSRMYSAVCRALLPTLILPKDCGVSLRDVNNKPGLVIEPATSAMSQGIRYLEPPRLSQDMWRLLDFLIKLHDRTWQIEDADRGEAPRGVIAASAIAELQERNAVLMRHKIRSVDYLVRNRGRAFISFYQNFGVVPDVVEVDDTSHEIIGVNTIGKNFTFVVESGSTMHKTSLQTQEQAVKLREMGVIDNQATLEALGFPNWKRIVERVGESQLDQALQILVQAGLPQQNAVMLRDYLAQAQGGPGM